MRTTVTLDDDVFEAASAQAKASGKRLGEVLSLLARRGLREGSQRGRRNGLPVFAVAGNAGVIPGDRAARLLAEDAR